MQTEKHWEKRYHAIVKSLRRLQDAGEASEQRLKASKGRPDGKSIQALIDQLASLWRSWTGGEPSLDKKTKRPFVMFIREAFAVARIDVDLRHHQRVVLTARCNDKPIASDRRSSESDNVDRSRTSRLRLR